MAGTKSDLKKTVDTVHHYLKLGYLPKGVTGSKSSAVEAAAGALGISGPAMHSRLRTAERNGVHVNWKLYVAPTVEAAPTIEPKLMRSEARNTDYWRGQAKSLEKDLEKVEHALEELAGLRDLMIAPPKWLAPKRDRLRNSSVICMNISDVHAGEVIDPDEILGINAFNVEICRKRLRRLFAATCEIGTRWGSDTKSQGAVVFLTGDLISGDIHEELRITNALTAHEQVRFMVQECAAGISHLIEAFGRVHVSGVPGNHGRTTFKPTAKLYSRLSYDILIVSMLEDHFRHDKRVTFQYGPAFDQVVPILGFPIFQTHGDKMGTGGGAGFAGPMLPILRGSKKVEIQQGRSGRTPYWLVHGHFHTSGQPGNVFSNGSVPGYSEYAQGLRCSLEPPQQWIWLMHEAWGVRDRLEVKLEDITPYPALSNTMPAQMARAA